MRRLLSLKRTRVICLLDGIVIARSEATQQSMYLKTAPSL